MMAKRQLAAALTSAALLATLAACGSKEDLKPVAGQPAPVIPLGASRAPTTEELTTPDAQALPARSDELLKRSERREPDDFDLPPPG
jgi:predicted small lipoprotein YifL